MRLRPATREDSAFAFLVKERAFRHHIEAVWTWDDEEQRQLHSRRFTVQEFFVIEFEDVDVGVLAKSESTDNVTVKQLFILPEYQRQGIGREVMLLVIRAASEAQRAVELGVLKVNSEALAFFEGLGFKTYSETPTHHLLRRDSNSHEP